VDNGNEIHLAIAEVLEAIKAYAERPNLEAFVAEHQLREKEIVAPSGKVKAPQRKWGDLRLGILVSDGWHIREVPRLQGTMLGHLDKYYEPPNGQLLRSEAEVRRYMSGAETKDSKYGHSIPKPRKMLSPELHTYSGVDWQEKGHPWIGQKALRSFSGWGRKLVATVIAYAAPGEQPDEPALWRCRHDDNAQLEDLEEKELAAFLDDYKATKTTDGKASLLLHTPQLAVEAVPQSTKPTGLLAITPPQPTQPSRRMEGPEFVRFVDIHFREACRRVLKQDYNEEAMYGMAHKAWDQMDAEEHHQYKIPLASEEDHWQLDAKRNPWPYLAAAPSCDKGNVRLIDRCYAGEVDASNMLLDTEEVSIKVLDADRNINSSAEYGGATLSASQQTEFLRLGDHNQPGEVEARISKRGRPSGTAVDEDEEKMERWGLAMREERKEEIVHHNTAHAKKSRLAVSEGLAWH